MAEPHLLEQLKQVPDSPGVYLWKDSSGEVLYVGKAKSLRKRMKQYVLGQDERVKIPLMMERVTSFDYVVTSNEVESLILEVNLIGQFSPPFNVDYRDDKSFPFIALTVGDTFPGIKYTREKRKADTRYFGPYTDPRAARETVDTVRRIVPICRCSCPEWKRVKARGGAPVDRPCFDSHIGLGPGVCTGAISQEEYMLHIERVTRFLSGHHEDLESELQTSMFDASANLDFEAAARFRNRLEAIASIKQKQKMVSEISLNVDVVGFFREETIAGVYVLVVREGRVLYGNEFVLDKGLNVSLDELVSGFLTRYYSETPQTPQEIVIEVELEDRQTIEMWLGTLRAKQGNRGTRVRLGVPQKGIKHDLLIMAKRNAQHALLRFKVRTRYDDERINLALIQLESALSLNCAPYRIECYDISTLHGSNSTGSMVVFTNGVSDKAQYRRFKIRHESDEANDVAMMREVLSRRFSQDRQQDGKFGSMPDLLIIDGGKPQLNAVRAVLEELGVDVPVAGLAKREEELWVTFSNQPVILPDGSPSLYLVKRVRDEAHRFAVEYHRILRSKAMTASLLDEIDGIGPKRRKALIRYFGSFKKLKEASMEDIAQVAGVSLALAKDIYSLLNTEL